MPKTIESDEQLVAGAVMPKLVDYLEVVYDRKIFTDAEWVRPSMTDGSETLVLRTTDDEHILTFTHEELRRASAGSAWMDLLREAVLSWVTSLWELHKELSSTPAEFAIHRVLALKGRDVWKCAGTIIDGFDCQLEVEIAGDSFCGAHRRSLFDE